MTNQGSAADSAAGFDPNRERMIKVATAVAALAAGYVAQKALQSGWRMATGRPAPGADDDDVSLGEALVFTALSAAAVAVIRVWVTRGAHRVAEKALPGETQPV